jgi:hypothetical protein
MPIDPSILFKAQPLQLENPVNAMAKAMQLRAMQDESQVNMLRAQGLEAELARGKEWKNAFGTGPVDFESPDLQAKLMAINPERTLDILSKRSTAAKNAADAKKTGVEISKLEQENEISALKSHEAILPYVTTPQQMRQWMAGVSTDKRLKNSQLAQLPLEQLQLSVPDDPKEFADFRNQVGMGFKDFAGSKRGIPVPAGGSLADPMKYEQAPSNPAATAPKVEIKQTAPSAGRNAQVVQVTPGVANQPPTVAATDIPNTALPTESEKLSDRDIAARNKAYPNAKLAVEALEVKNAKYVKDLRDLADHPGLDGITGPIYGRLPSGRKESVRAESLFRQIQGTDTLSVIENARLASPTGANPLGNVTNTDKDMYKDTTGIDRLVDKDALKQKLLQRATEIEASSKRIRKAFDETYEYKTAAPKETSGAPKAGTVVDGYRFKGGDPGKKENWEKQ